MSDCDGYTSAAIFINYLNRLFPHFSQTNIIYRIHNGKEHGLISETIPDDVKLVVAPDAGSSQFDVHKELYDRGIDVLCIDHHHCPEYSKYSCVINNQMCDYPTKSLSGAGVTYKFCSYIDELLGTNYAEDYIDLVAVGILADVMPLKEIETRQIILRGMERFLNPLLKAMVEKDEFHFGGGLTPFNITWYIAPFINAICRSGTLPEKTIVFESMIEFLAYEAIPSTKRGCQGQYESKVEQALRVCVNVKNRQSKAKEEMSKIISAIIEKDNLLENKIIIVKLEPEQAVNKNLTGLIANELIEKYCRPVFILNKIIEDNIVKWRGSGRGYDKGNLGDLRLVLEESGLVEFAQGHASAFGLSVLDENFEALLQYLNEIYKDFDYTSIYSVDFIWKENELTADNINGLLGYDNIWGRGVEKPLVAIENLRVSKDRLKLFGLEKNRPTINIQLPNGSSLVKFKSSEEEYELLHSELGYVIINAIGSCMRNNWGNPQIQILDYEIVARIDYYF